MTNEDNNNNEDPGSVSRKQDHIQLAEASRVIHSELDRRFYYEPILAGHPSGDIDISKSFLGKTLANPIWVSSMTGGTEKASIINENLAKACHEFGMGMGLGSCRKLLYDNDYFEDFNVRKYIGDQPLFANLGIAQIEQIHKNKDWSKVEELINKLQADGLIIHINPLQEWLQPEGDEYHSIPLDLIKHTIDALNTSIIVKEVGQGMGIESLKALINIPIDAIEFAAGGGTNFAKLELLRSDASMKEMYMRLAHIGHTAVDMVAMLNTLLETHDNNSVPDIIISGGVKDFLDGYYLISKCKANAVYGQASSFLNHAMGDYGALQSYVHAQIEGLKLSNALLKVR